jgi:hypothetical protein
MKLREISWEVEVPMRVIQPFHISFERNKFKVLLNRFSNEETFPPAILPLLISF